MYNKDSTERPVGAKAGAILILPLTGAAPGDALVAQCDGCGAQLWITPEFANKLEAGNHRTFCSECLQIRKVV